MKVLIVDDKADVRALILATLDMGDFEILEADNGKKGLEMARTHHPDLMILDVMMPGELDGYQVCQQIKAAPATKDIFVLMLTAQGEERGKTRGAEVGADDYFTKPFSPRELMDKVYSVLHL